MEMLEYIGSIGGIAGVLAILMFSLMKHLIGQMRDDRKFMEDRLTGVIKDYNEVCRANREALVKHTQILTELITWLRTNNSSG